MPGVFAEPQRAAHLAQISLSEAEALQRGLMANIKIECPNITTQLAELSALLDRVCPRLSEVSARQLVQLTLNLFHRGGGLVGVNGRDGAAGASDGTVTVQLSQRALGFIAAVRSLDRELEVVFERHGALLRSVA